MPETPALERAEAAARGQAIIAALPADIVADRYGQPVAIDVGSGDYEIDNNDYRAVCAIRSRRPGARIFLGRVGGMPMDRIGYFPARIGP